MKDEVGILEPLGSCRLRTSMWCKGFPRQDSRICTERGVELLNSTSSLRL